jgi:Na+/proline symporter
MDWLLFLAVETLGTVILTLTAASVTLTYLWRRSGSLKAAGTKNFEQLFVTGRNVGDVWLLSWATYSTMAGAWVIPCFGFIGYMYGLSGLLVASAALGAQCVAVTALSTSAYKHLPETCSLPRSIRVRFGAPLEVYTLVVMLLANLFSLASEYTALVGIFGEVLGIDARAVLGAVTVLSVYYVCCGGALVGLFTDQIHGILGLAALLGVVGYYGHAAKQYPPPPTNIVLYGFDKQATQWTFLGNVFVFFTLVSFYEILWQKHICSRVKTDLWKASSMAGISAALTCFVWGVPGMVAAWKDMAEGTQFWGMSYVLYVDK